MIFKEYSEKNKKNIHNMHTERVVHSESELKQTQGQIEGKNFVDGVLDDSALDAVAGGVGNIEGGVNVKVNNENKSEKDVGSFKFKDNHRNNSLVEKHISVKGDIVADGGISF